MDASVSSSCRHRMRRRASSAISSRNAGQVWRGGGRLARLRRVARARRPRPSSGSTSCTCCHCRRGRDHCVRSWPWRSGLKLRRMHPLYQALLADARFHELLLAFDRDLADTARCAGCALCSGVLHSARYRRKPRGRLCRLGEEHDWRFSFCCARRRLPHAGDTAVAAVPRPQGLSRRHGGADLDHAAGRMTGARMRRLSEAVGRRSPHDRTLAGMVARRASRRARSGRIAARRVHAAGRSGSAAGLAARALRR